MQLTKPIVVVGSVNVDMVLKGARLPRPGETVIGGEFAMAQGGKGANQAVAAARLGAPVTLLAKVGRDTFGDQSLDALRGEGIDVNHALRDPECATGVAVILIDAAGENSIAVSSGANARWTVAEIDAAAPVIRDAAVVMLQLEIPPQVVERVAEIAAQAGVAVILDPAPAAPLARELLAATTYLTPNEHEARALSGIEVCDEASARAAAAWLRSAGARNVIITLGAKGALVATPAGAELIAAPVVSAVDTTAAGDAFNGGLACGLMRGLELSDAVREASFVAALATTRLGAQPSLPTAAEVERFRREQLAVDARRV